MHESVFKNRLNNRAGAFRNHIHGHKLRLHVGWETRVFGCSERLRDQRFRSRAFHPQTVRLTRHLDTGLKQLFDDRIQMITARMAQHHVAAGCPHGTQERASLNPICHNLMEAAR